MGRFAENSLQLTCRLLRDFCLVLDRGREECLFLRHGTCVCRRDKPDISSQWECSYQRLVSSVEALEYNLLGGLNLEWVILISEEISEKSDLKIGDQRR